MIRKPNNYEQLKNSRETLTAGGHKCFIQEAKETTDASGRDIFVVYFDTDNDDAQPAYFTNIYLKDTRPDKKWPYSGQRTFWQESKWFESNVAKLTGAIEKSNPEINIWDPRTLSLNLDWIKNLKIGIVFGEEEYIKQDGTIGVSIKPRYFCGYDEALNQPAPKKKETKQRPDVPQSGFMEIDVDAEGLPFM